MTVASDLPWCVISTGSGRERDIQAELYLAGWVTYLPMETVEHRIGRNRVVLRRPLFPRYLFAACMAGGDVSAPRAIRGLVAVRRRSDGGAVVRGSLMIAMQTAEAAGAFDRRPKPKAPKKAFKLGQAVSVVDGVMTGWEARIVAILSKREVRAAVDLFGRRVELTFSTANLEAA